MKFYLMPFVLTFPLLINAQNYDVHRTMAENPSYIMDEYYEIVKNDSGQPMVLHYTKYFFQGSTTEKREYALGTPFYLDIEWHKGTLKMPGQQLVEGFLSYNQASQRIYFKNAANATERMLVNPEYFIINNVIFNSFPDYSIMENAYFKSVSFDEINMVCLDGKLQANDINLEILDPYNITDKTYTAEFIPTPSYFVFKNKKALKVEDKNYFYKQFGHTKKRIKPYILSENINLRIEEDVKKLLTELLN
jgi:hypothetical protein